MNRRSFLKSSLFAAPFLAGGCKGLFSPEYAPRRNLAPSQKVNVALVGCGTQMLDNVRQLLADGRVRVTVCCDPVLEAPGYFYDAKRLGGRKPFKEMVDKAYGDSSCRMVEDWREVVADPSVDALMICTPDHWHAIISIAAMKAGKHVYCQKPLALSIEEGIAMTRVAKASGVSFQVGNQGRSSPSRRTAVEILLNGMLGKLVDCDVTLPGGSGGKWGHKADASVVPLPSYFSRETWNLWQGPAEHWDGNAFIPGIHEPMCWRWNKRYGNGMVADFTPHIVDTVHQAIGADRSGPVAIDNVVAGDFQPNREVFSWAGSYSYDLHYACGFVAHVASARPNRRDGLFFRCADGSMALEGNKLEIFGKDGAKATGKILKEWKALAKAGNAKRIYAPKDAHNHESDWIDGIYENRPTCSECEFGHRTITTGHLANICISQGRASAAWDPVKESFTGASADLNKFRSVEYHNGWKLEA